MKTAQDYLDGLDKEAVVGTLAAKVGKGVAKIFGNKAGGVAGSKVARMTKGYQKTNMYKNYGNTPLHLAGGAAAGGVVL